MPVDGAVKARFVDMRVFPETAETLKPLIIEGYSAKPAPR